MERRRDVHASVRVIKDHDYHWHENLTIVMVVAGEVNLRVWAENNHMREGDIIVLNKKVIHRLKAITQENLAIIITLSNDFCTNVCRGFEDAFILCNSIRYKKHSGKKYQDLELRLEELVYKCVCEEYSQEVKAQGEEIVRYIYDNFDYVSSGYRHRRFSEYIVFRNRMLYRKIFREKDEFFSMSLKEISDQLGINYTYFRTDIIERFGYSYSWLKYTMMTEKAGRMIIDTDRRLIDISNECGFSDSKYLRKYIKIFYENTPSEMRKLHKRDCCKEDYVEIPLKYILRLHRYLEKLQNEDR